MSGPKPSVLLVEDDPAVAQLYAIKLRMDGYRVDIAKDAATAAVIFEKARPDLVCVDSRLPDGDGRGVVVQLVGAGATVVMLTNDQEAYEQPPAGVVAALLKWRTTPVELSKSLARLLPARQTR